MYYVLQVAPGMEEQTEKLIRGRIESSAYGRCFHPMRLVQKKFRGEWNDYHERLLPGYVFITSDAVQELYQKLRQVPVLTKMLGKEEECFVALRDNEVAWLECLMQMDEWENQRKSVTEKNSLKAEPNRGRGKAEGTDVAEIGLSQVLAEEDGITILSGPLKNMEGTIKKIHLHKRLAVVQVEWMGRKTEIYLGIELVKKKDRTAAAAQTGFASNE